MSPSGKAVSVTDLVQTLRYENGSYAEIKRRTERYPMKSEVSVYFTAMMFFGSTGRRHDPTTRFPDPLSARKWCDQHAGAGRVEDEQ